MQTPDHVNGSDLSFPSSPSLSMTAAAAGSLPSDHLPHPTAARSAFPRGIEVDLGQGSTRYSDDEIRARFVDRGAKVGLNVEEGKIGVHRTEKAYEFKTLRNVPKTGCVRFSSSFLSSSLSISGPKPTCVFPACLTTG